MWSWDVRGGTQIHAKAAKSQAGDLAGRGRSNNEVLRFEREFLLRGDGVVHAQHGDGGGKRLVGGTIERGAFANRVEEVFQVRLVNGFVERHRKIPRGELGGFADVD